MKSVMPAQQHFATVPQIGNIQRSTFDRSKGHKTTFDSGQLIPFYLDEILPGDTQNVKTSIFARLATPIKPIMDNMYMETFYFFVPNRILWENWEAFNGQVDNPLDPTIDYLVPTINLNVNGRETGSLADHFGIAVGASLIGANLQAMPFRAYNKIYNDWFKDENLINNIAENLGDGPDFPIDYPVQRRGKRHDYFTSCLPFPQKGDPVTIGLTGTIPVMGDGSTLGFYDNNGGFAGTVQDSSNQINTDISSNNAAVGAAGNPPYTPLTSDLVIGISTNPNDSGLIGDLSGVTAVTINDLREAVAIQQVLEMDARGGTRYTEFLKAHFGVTSPDFRLQRAEYLGGSSDMININPVTQTSPSGIQGAGGDLSAQANLAATGTVSSTRGGYTKSFTEHGWVIGLVNVRADLTYQNNVERFWRRKTRYDFYLPSFANLGEQAVMQSEIHFTGIDYTTEPVFGYQERWAEYRYNPSQITGFFRSNVTGGESLDIWHLSQDFGLDIPLLNQEFITENPPIDRVVALPEEPQFIFDSYLNIKHTRAMPMYSVPGLRRF